jgi:hypothetical protein
VAAAPRPPEWGIATTREVPYRTERDMSTSPDPFASPTVEAEHGPESWAASEGAVFQHPRGAVVVGLGVFIGVAALKILGLAYQVWAINTPDVAYETLETSDRLTQSTALLNLAVLVTTFVLWGMWAHRAALNLRALRPDGVYEYTPGSYVWWYFVPLANLVKPFHAMRELFLGTHDAADVEVRTTQLLGVWWAGWLAGNILRNIANRLVPNPDRVQGDGYISQLTTASVLDIVSDLATILAALAAIQLIRGINRLQIQARRQKSASA